MSEYLSIRIPVSSRISKAHHETSRSACSRFNARAIAIDLCLPQTTLLSFRELTSNLLCPGFSKPTSMLICRSASPLRGFAIDASASCALRSNERNAMGYLREAKVSVVTIVQYSRSVSRRNFQSYAVSLLSSEDSSCVVIRWFFACSGLRERLESLEPRFKSPPGALVRIGVFDWLP